MVMVYTWMILVYLLFFIFMWNFWFWKHSVSQCLSAFFVFFSLSEFFIFALARKCNLSCTSVESPYSCRRFMLLWLLSRYEGKFNREENYEFFQMIITNEQMSEVLRNNVINHIFISNLEQCKSIDNYSDYCYEALFTMITFSLQKLGIV